VFSEHDQMQTRELVCLVLALLLVSACEAAAPGTAPRPEVESALTVAAASSVQFAFTELGRQFEAQTGHRVVFVFGSTGNLAAQIEHGAPFDLFAAADEMHIELLRAKSLIIEDTQRLYALGRIVLAANTQLADPPQTLWDLLRPEVTRVAIANPDHAPYGMTARQVLVNAGLWDTLQPKLVYGETVRQALQFVQTGNAEAGIVARSIADVPEVTYTLIPAEVYDPLRQAMAVIRGARHEQVARQFAAFVTGPEGRAVMVRYGFTVVEPELPMKE